MSVIAKKVGMRRKSREEDSSSSSHLIKEDGSLMDPTHDDPVCNVPLPEQKLEKTMTVGSFRASDLVRYVSQSTHYSRCSNSSKVREKHYEGSVQIRVLN